MKVMQINTVCGSGSTGRIAAGLCRRLDLQGGRGLVAYGRGRPPGDIGIESYRIGNLLDVCYHGAVTRLFDAHGFAGVRATRALIERIRAFEPDVLHLHNLHGYYLHLPTLFDFIGRSGVPVIWTLHDCWAFTGHCGHYDFIGCTRWRTECHDCPRKREYPASSFLDGSRRNFIRKKALFTLPRKMTLAVPSQWLARQVEKSFLGAFPVQVIPNGIDLDVFRPRAGTFRERFALQDCFLILGASNGWPESKGLRTFHHLAGKLEDPCRIVLAGLSPKQIRECPPRILGLPRTPSALEMAELYSAADLFVNPSLEESFSNVNLEAQACGVPVAAYRAGGSPETILSGGGTVVERGDEEGLAAAIETMRRTRARVTASDRDLEWMGEERFFNSYLELYQREGAR